MKLLVDMNLSPRWVGLLEDAGIKAAHWSALGAKNAPDTEIMAYARVNSYVVLTHDLDFSAILAALRQMTSELKDGALLTIDPNRTRIRLLPLHIKPLDET